MGSPQTGLVFSVGVVAGFILSFIFINYSDIFSARSRIIQTSGVGLPAGQGGSRVFANVDNNTVIVHRHDNPMSHESVEHADKEYIESDKMPLDLTKDTHAHHDDDRVSRQLYDKVRVLVWVMTQPSSLESKARHVNATWGKRANKILYASDAYDPTFPTLPIVIQHGRDHLTAKTMAAFDYVYKHYLNDYDWFMKADDDTYVIMENLRYFLNDEDTTEPVFFGHWFKVIVKQGYYSGGGGYVLSREALKRFGERPKDFCQKDHGAEDVAFGHCMEKLGVHTKESLDNQGRSRFHCFNPQNHLRGGFPDWYLKYDKYNASLVGLTGISDYPISFHYCSIEVMYDMEYYVYHLRPYGILSGLQNLNVAKQQTSHGSHDEQQLSTAESAQSQWQTHDKQTQDDNPVKNLVS